VPILRSSHDSDTSKSSSVHSSASVVEIENPYDTPEIQTLGGLYPLDAEEEDLDTDLHAESEESDEDDEDEEEPVRTNKFLGLAQTWDSYTEADRQIVESLEQMEDTDLAAHLYNAHALKRRLRRPVQDLAQLKSWQSKDSWLKTGKDLEYTDAAGLTHMALVPPKEWTAWPVPPEEQPSLDDELDSGLAGGQAAEWIIGSANDELTELKEELLAVFLRLARKQWDQREAPLSEADSEERAGTSRSRSRAGSTKSVISRPTSPDDEEIDLHGRSHDEKCDRGYESTSGKKRGRKAYVKTLTEPTILADDARAERLLGSTIQSMISRLDRLALAILRTRLNHFGRTSGDSSMSDFTSGAESSRPASKSSSRDRSKGVTSDESNIRPPSRARLTRDDHRTLQGTKLADVDGSSSEASDHSASKNCRLQRKRRRSSDSSAKSDSSTAEDERLREGLMDWSEVLGIAAVQGWDQGAIARTAQRCATLFGESMSFMSFSESLATKPPLEPVVYTPSTIPAPLVPSIARGPVPNRPFFQTGTLRCPHLDCYGYKKDFAIPYRTIEHCIRVHGYDPRTNKSYDEEGAADGFLQPVTVRPGWFGNGRPKIGQANKRAKSRQIDSRATSEDYV